MWLCTINFNDELDFNKFKNRIFAVHLHDNDQSDDLHLLPFDGTLNWNETIRKLKESNYEGPVTLEIHHHRDYVQMSVEDFYKKGYEIALKIKEIFE